MYPDLDRMRILAACSLACQDSKPARSPVDGQTAQLAHEPWTMSQSGPLAVNWRPVLMATGSWPLSLVPPPFHHVHLM
ncbi:hypothetical protein N7516_000646 [Penicillium verrucosum]|uniref:uncharacterized protein n=1 Tax=Penicillium verrucosum TaxID=60171 RepID=UPI0025456A2C|nr:uncharacterized protein N7516_000646 [Penicillium verrucosum]KAJ5940478.1 hypothetical protein N7516_000646 [Penicillium verrucosum]